jgi:uncharacterized protein YdeI (YjbR/CyaY-like superfamily)
VAERQFGTVRPKDAGAWRRWLEKNHAGSGSVWVVINKKGTPRPGLFYEEAVEQALCFGWIDGRINPLDEKRYRLLISPRRRGGTWAKSNRERVERLTAEGRMAPAGLDRVEEAKKDGTWNALEALDSLDMPADLEEALSASGPARETVAGWTDSYRKRLYWWVSSAKRQETRSSRIAKVLEAASAGRKPFI